MLNGLVIDRYGTQEWFLNGKAHRTDGPAITYADGSQVWCLNGEECTFTQYCTQLNLNYDDELILRLKYNV